MREKLRPQPVLSREVWLRRLSAAAEREPGDCGGIWTGSNQVQALKAFGEANGWFQHVVEHKGRVELDLTAGREQLLAKLEQLVRAEEGASTEAPTGPPH